MSEAQHIRSSVDAAGIATITIARPDKRNALTPAMLDALLASIQTHAANASPNTTTRAILLTGEGDLFCAGFDLSLCRDDDTVLPALLSGLSACIAALRNAPCPVIISAHGAAIAGGCALLGGGDIVLTTDDAKIGYPVVKLGISPAVSAPTLTSACGHGPARARLLDTQLISGRDAARLGLASESLPTRDACEARAREITTQLAAKPAHALAATKHWLNTITPQANESNLRAALNTSLALVGQSEEKQLLPQAWTPKR
jgi:methylglutaconyl-CoA hydratase